MNSPIDHIHPDDVAQLEEDERLLGVAYVERVGHIFRRVLPTLVRMLPSGRIIREDTEAEVLDARTQMLQPVNAALIGPAPEHEIVVLLRNPPGSGARYSLRGDPPTIHDAVRKIESWMYPKPGAMPSGPPIIQRVIGRTLLEGFLTRCSSWHDTAETIERYVRFGVCAVACAYGHIIGSAVGYTSGDDFHLYAVEVLPAWQRKRIAKVLVTLVLQAAQEGQHVTAVAATEAGRALLAQFPEIAVVEKAPAIPVG